MSEAKINQNQEVEEDSNEATGWLLKNGPKKSDCKQTSQCAEEKSNESVEDMEGTFAGW